MNLFASVLRLDRQAIKALRVTDLYSLHRVVYDLFNDVRTREQKLASVSSGIQWVDKGGDHQYRNIFILSCRLPTEPRAGIIETKPLPANYLDHQCYRFSVTINPCKRENISRKLVPIKGKSEIVEWFTGRASTHWGFSVDPQHVQVDKIKVMRTKEKHSHSITLQQVDLSGYLTVTDRDRFASSVARGVGRGRAFGCGLLQIVPVSDSIFL